MLSSEDAEDAGIAVQEKVISEEPLDTGDSDDQPTPSGLPTANEPDWGTEVQAEDLSAFITKVGKDAVGGGGFGDVYKGIWSQMDLKSSSFMKKIRVLSHLNDKEVAIKVIRPLVPDGKHREAVKRRLKREIGLWQRLHHENILPLVGVTYNFGVLPAPISLWQNNGTVRTYLEYTPDANRYELLRGVARGLSFLHDHTPKIIHGDMKPDNILINDWGGPYLSDFGISAVYDEHTFWKTATTSAKGTMRYMSPELINGEVKKPTEASDAYAYAMTCLEIMTGKPPFYHYPVEGALIVAVCMRDERPERPAPLLEEAAPDSGKENLESGQDDPESQAVQAVQEEVEGDDTEEARGIAEANITDELWKLIAECWVRDPASRPAMREVLKKLTVMCAAEKPLRLLSIDGGGISAISSLVTLKALMEVIGPNAKPCDHFDMIAGSEAGGVVALMLGRLRWSVDECISSIQTPFGELFNTTIEKQMKKASKNDFRFSWYNLQDALRPAINAKVGDKNARAMPDPRRNLCRTFVTARNKDTKEPIRLRTYPMPDMPPFPHRVWVAMGATMCTELNFEQVYGENTSLAVFDNPDFTHVNPSLELLDEAQKVFGDHRRVAAFVSIGNGLSTLTFSEDPTHANMTNGLPEPLLSKLRNEALTIEANEIKTRNLCEPGSFYRFEPGEYIHHSEMDPSRWKETFAYEQVYRMSDMQDVTKMYLAQETIGQQLKECANRLPRLKTGSRASTMGSIVSRMDSMNISRSSQSDVSPPL